MPDEAQTRPTLDTILERINALGTELHADMESLRQEVHNNIESFRQEVHSNIGSFRHEVNGNVESLRQEVNAFRVAVEGRLEEIETRLDRTQGIALETRADLKELKADLRNRSKQPA